MKVFFNKHQDVYDGTEPPIYDVNLIPEVKKIEAHFETIQRELYAVLNNPTSKEIAFKKKSFAKSPNWTQIELMLYGLRYQNKLDVFPETMKVLSEIKGISTVYFSFLDANSTIKAHNGDTDAFYRIHLGIEIPDTLPACGMEVGGTKFEWKEGKCIAFNDIYYHTAWNHSDKRRVVLIIDLLLPQHRDNSLYVNSGVITTLIFSRLYKYIGIFIELLPRIITRAIHPILHFFTFHYFKLRKLK